MMWRVLRNSAFVLDSFLTSHLLPPRLFYTMILPLDLVTPILASFLRAFHFVLRPRCRNRWTGALSQMARSCCTPIHPAMMYAQARRARPAASMRHWAEETREWPVPESGDPRTLTIRARMTAKMPKYPANEKTPKSLIVASIEWLELHA